MAKAPRYEGLHREMAPGEAGRSILRALVRAAFAEAPAALRGDDVAAVHDMRVALRRLRTAQRTFRANFPRRESAKLEKATRRLARRLGEIRDADVHLAVLRPALAGATALETPGVTYAIHTIVERRRAALANFAIELSQFDRKPFELDSSGA